MRLKVIQFHGEKAELFESSHTIQYLAYHPYDIETNNISQSLIQEILSFIRLQIRIFYSHKNYPSYLRKQ